MAMERAWIFEYDGERWRIVESGGRTLLYDGDEVLGDCKTPEEAAQIAADMSDPFPARGFNGTLHRLFQATSRSGFHVSEESVCRRL